ncbi:BsuBI/PstI family type II restriction endonuclease [Magnetospirillum aberrantis]|uniref:Cytosine-specific methyltransferase n=1 Tax=Magnetospirillum aberrantis SpK TaxID=908842 RepID=A0A7C9UW41_9PROT|nr:DNA (cytosine-5-)-methyltransferase [Magnetospirillum aberrantis SpK]
MVRRIDSPGLLDFSDHEAWLPWVQECLPDQSLPPTGPVVMDLFAGCGGMALGFESQGFLTAGYEMKPAVAATYSKNLAGPCDEVFLTVGMPEGKAEVLIGGPPCQPFSQIGYQRGKRDPRDGFPIFLDAVERVRPKIAIIENVRGLLFRNKDYLRQVADELTRFGYAVDARLLKAAEFGVPQKRERVVIVASRVGWSWPEAVVSNPVTAGIALGPLAYSHGPDSRFLTASMDRYVAEYERKSNCVRPRDLHLDQPSRTVTCRNLGGATSDMLRIRLLDGRRRMLTVREAARLQGFPDWFTFEGGEYDQFEQIGNAVPPLMGRAIAAQVWRHLDGLPPGAVPVAKGMGEILDSDTVTIKIEQAQNILRSIGVPLRDYTARRRERLALALLAVAHLAPGDGWSNAKSHLVDNRVPPVTTRQIIAFWNKYYGENVADSSYDDVRRKDLVILVEVGLVAKSAANSAADTNDGTRGYAIVAEALPLLQSYGGTAWDDELIRFRAQHVALADRLSKAREMKMVPVTLPGGQELKLSPGPHNAIQKAVVEQFLPRFSRGAQVLYIGDTENKLLYCDEAALKTLGLPELSRDMLPDVVAYEPERNWLFLVEAVHSSNPISEIRHMKLREFTKDCTAGCVYVSAFETMKAFAKFSKEIGWETEAWVASKPEHMIHFNGCRFLGPYER